MYLVDTHVFSEARKGKKTNIGVRHFWETADPADPADLYIAVQSIGEIRRGLENIRQRGDVTQSMRLEAWLDEVVTHYADRILDFDLDAAQVWGRLMSSHLIHSTPLTNKSRPSHSSTI